MKKSSNKSGGHLLVVGMARSGTTFVTDLIARSGSFHVEIEPHALWKSGNFKYLNDEEFDIKESTIKRLRRSFLTEANGQRILEKSPINCLRPQLVHAVFPDAKIVYIERDPVRCIYSNYLRSVKNDSFKPSITLRKYFLKTGSEDLPYAVSERSLFKQITLFDLPYFLRYVIWMIWNRNIKPSLFPFGPKKKGFMEYVKKYGILSYHVLLFKKSVFYKSQYEELFKEQIKSFKLEDLMNQEREIKRLLEWAEVEYHDKEIRQLLNEFDSDRKAQAVQNNVLDEEIRVLLDRIKP